MTDVRAPADADELASVIADANAARTPLAIHGGGTRTGLGRPVDDAIPMTTSALNGVTLYEPSELVISAGAGTPLAEIETLLAAHGQRLPFEPMDHRRIFHGKGTPTIGGVVAANISGPRRIQAGAARDSLIGLRAVNGKGEIVKSGGRVMKNVTGYDLVKFLAGSYGTLAVLTEMTFKVLPIPEREATLVLSGLDDTAAIAALAASLGSPFSVTGAAHRPASDAEPARSFVRLEGFAASVDDHATRLARELAGFSGAKRIDGADSVEAWTKIRDVALPGVSGDVPIWRLSTKPSNGPLVVETIRRSFDCQVLFDWGGGLIWIAGGEGEKDAGAVIIRAVIADHRGYATLIRASDDIRSRVAVFQPLPPAMMALTRGLKQTFDPAGILNPGRMYERV